MEMEDINGLDMPILRAIRDQSNVLRYNVRKRTREQNVAEHVGRASMIAVCVQADLAHWAQKVPFELFLAVMNSVAFHDIAESITGDIIYPVKEAVPQTKQMEAHVHGLLTQTLPTRPHGLGTMPPLVHMFRDLVDMAELVMFCYEEVEAGNQKMAKLALKGSRYLTEIQEKFLTLYQNWMKTGHHMDLPPLKSLPTITAILKGDI